MVKKPYKFVTGLLSLLFIILSTVGCKHKVDLVLNTGEPPTNLVYSPSFLEFEQGTNGSSSVPTIEGDTAFSYKISTTPYTTPIQVSIDNQGVISIDSTVALGNYAVTVTVSNDAGAETFVSAFSFSVTNTPTTPYNLLYSPNSLSIADGTTGSSVVPTVNGTVPLSYSLTTTPVSSDIVIDTVTGVISVINPIAIDTYVCDVTATNSAGSMIFTGAYTINVTTEAPSNLVYAPNSMSLVNSNTATTSATPTIDGSPTITYVLTSTPSSAKITIDAQGVISIQAGLGTGTYVINIDATNAAGTTNFPGIYNVDVSTGAATAPSNLVYTPNSLSLPISTGGVSVSPSISGTTPITYTLTSTPSSSEISINANTGIITATALLSVGSYDIDVTATNSAGSAPFSSVYSIVVNTAAAPSNLVYTPDNLSLSSGNTGSSSTPTIDGTQPITYTLTSSPTEAGLTIDPNTGVISANSAVPVGIYYVEVIATNSIGNAVFSNVYTVTINATLISYAVDIYPIMVSNCNNCHTTGPQTLYTIYSNTVADANLIYDRVTRTQGSAGFMPKNGTALLQSEQDLILQWINDGLQP